MESRKKKILAIFVTRGVKLARGVKGVGSRKRSGRRRSKEDFIGFGERGFARICRATTKPRINIIVIKFCLQLSMIPLDKVLPLSKCVCCHTC